MQVLVVGAGVVGLAIARAAAIAGHEVIVAEAESAIGTVTSARNSEVIHAGLYYPTNTWRARLCAPGRRTLYQYCASHGVPHKKTGKLVVATSDPEIKKLPGGRGDVADRVDNLERDLGRCHGTVC
jgi:L-2-hydroxyglutarate oxidase LhgO